MTINYIYLHRSVLKCMRVCVRTQKYKSKCIFVACLPFAVVARHWLTEWLVGWLCAWLVVVIFHIVTTMGKRKAYHKHGTVH